MLAQAIEHVLHDMRELDDAIEPKQPGRAFDGMRTAEHRPEGIIIFGVLVQVEQQGFELNALFLRFFEKNRGSRR